MENIMLNSIERVKVFNAFAMEEDNDIYLMQRNVKINAKSILGIFTFDLSKPIILLQSQDNLRDAFSCFISKIKTK